ncbi:MAG TPA: acetamidase/formamidase family protein, partial [Glaciihabitans sp.]|nr:acetamidase/formamidase family protein [Glaciihabitans sp.]
MTHTMKAWRSQSFPQEKQQDVETPNNVGRQASTFVFAGGRTPVGCWHGSGSSESTPILCRRVDATVQPPLAMHFFRALLTACCSTTVLAAAELNADHYLPFIPENVAIGHFPAGKPPILTVKSGATVRIDGGGGARWGDQDIDAWLKENNVPTSVAENPALAETARVLKEVKRAEGIPSGHLLVGPIAIEGAEPGDSLEVRILSVVPRIPYGTVSTLPGKGGIPDLVPRPWTRVVMLDLKRNVGIFEKGIEVPLGPFMGVMGTCPSEAEGAFRKSGPPGAFGGNLDCKELVAGTTLYLPVFRAGGLFYTGDSHAAQGDGEVTVSAIETANTCTLKFILHKGKLLKAPRA